MYRPATRCRTESFETNSPRADSQPVKIETIDRSSVESTYKDCWVMHSQRDLRIDFFRGVALLIVLVDHIEGWAETSVVEAWTLVSLGFSDAAEIFIFLSGYVLAMAYSSTLSRDGLTACIKKAVRRAFQIYVAYVLAALVILAIGALVQQAPAYNEQFRIGERFWSSVGATFALCFHPWGFDILALYVVLLPVMPIMLYLQRRSAKLAWLLSAGLYVVAQIYQHWTLPRYGDDLPWFFNPLAWQFLFFVGMYWGDPQRKRPSIERRWIWIGLATAILAFGFFTLKLSTLILSVNGSWLDEFMPIYRLYWAWGGKTTLQPLRLLHFFALLYLVVLFLPARPAFWSGRLARPLVVAGRHSLEVYAWGLVGSFLAVLFIMSRGIESARDIIAVDLVACAASLGFGYLIHWWKTPVAVASPKVANIEPEPKPPGQRKKQKSRKRRLVTSGQD